MQLQLGICSASLKATESTHLSEVQGACCIIWHSKKTPNLASFWRLWYEIKRIFCDNNPASRGRNHKQTRHSNDRAYCRRHTFLMVYDSLSLSSLRVRRQSLVYRFGQVYRRKNALDVKPKLGVFSECRGMQHGTVS